MPVFNEAGGLAEFLHELNQSLSAYATRFLIVDDCSTDNTVRILTELAGEGLPIEFLRSEVNRGHGPTTVRALRASLVRTPQLVVAIDGDGQFLGRDVALAVQCALDENFDVLEGVRAGRSDPWFRHLTSAVTRLLVRRRCGQPPKDANTPLRVYRPDILERLLGSIPSDSMTPNLLISALSRYWGFFIEEMPVSHRDRRGGSSSGSTWQSRRRNIPSLRFLRFCFIAIAQWMLLSEGQTP